jgi:hypothetical protein
MANKFGIDLDSASNNLKIELPRPQSLGKISENKNQEPGYYQSEIINSTTEFYLRICRHGGNSKEEIKSSDTLTKATFSYTFNKSINNIGSFSINIKNTVNISSLLSVMDWVVIYSGDNIDIAKNEGIRMVGMVERISQERAISPEGAVTTYWSISGSDHGKISEYVSMFIAPYTDPNLIQNISGIELIKGIVEDDSKPTSPSDWMKVAMEFLLKNKSNIAQYFKLKIPKSISKIFKNSTQDLYDNISWKFQPTVGNANVLLPKLGNVVKLSDLMMQYANLPFNEMIWEIYDKKPSFIFRPAVLTFTDLYNLAKSNYITIDDRFITKKDIGLSAHEIYNYLYFSVITDMEKTMEAHYNANSNPPADKESIALYGFRPFTTSIPYCQFSMKGQSGDINTSMLKTFYDLGEKYFFNKYKMLNGTIVVQTFNNFRLGQFVEIFSNATCIENAKMKDLAKDNKAQKWLLKVEEIAESWTWGQPINVVLKLSHGITSDGNFYMDKVKSTDGTVGVSFIENPITIKTAKK